MKEIGSDERQCYVCSRIVCNTCRSFGTSHQYIIYILFFLPFMVGLFSLHWPYSDRTCHAFDCLLCVTFTATKLTDVANLSAFNVYTPHTHTHQQQPFTFHIPLVVSSNSQVCSLNASFSSSYHIHGILCDLILIF